MSRQLFLQSKWTCCETPRHAYELNIRKEENTTCRCWDQRHSGPPRHTAYWPARYFCSLSDPLSMLTNRLFPPCWNQIGGKKGGGDSLWGHTNGALGYEPTMEQTAQRWDLGGRGHTQGRTTSQRERGYIGSPRIDQWGTRIEELDRGWIGRWRMRWWPRRRRRA